MHAQGFRKLWNGEKRRRLRCVHTQTVAHVLTANCSAEKSVPDYERRRVRNPAASSTPTLLGRRRPKNRAARRAPRRQQDDGACGHPRGGRYQVRSERSTQRGELPAMASSKKDRDGLFRRGEIYYCWIRGERVSTRCRSRKAAIAVRDKLERAAVDPVYRASYGATVGELVQSSDQRLIVAF